MHECQWIGFHGGWTGRLRLHDFQCTIAVVQRIVGEGFLVPLFTVIAPGGFVVVGLAICSCTYIMCFGFKRNPIC